MRKEPGDYRFLAGKPLGKHPQQDRKKDGSITLK
jgi:hypothetical protein